MRFIATLLALSLAACGGGGTSTPALQTAALQGLVYEVDGQTADRSGVIVEVLETGQAAVTTIDGRFAFPDVPAGAITLRFGSGAIITARQDGDSGSDEGEGEGEGEDESDDDEDSDEDESDDESDDDEDSDEDEDGDDESDDDDEEKRDEDSEGNPILETECGDLVNVRLSIRNGRVAEFSATCSQRQRADARLERAADSPDGDVEGKVKIDTRGGDQEFEVEAEHLAPGTIVEIFLRAPGEDTAFVSVGTAAANADGEAEFERDTGDGDTLPLGVTEVAALEGYDVSVRLATTGDVLLVGEVPSLPEVDLGDFDDVPNSGDDARGKARLEAIAGVEASVEIRRRLGKDESQRFKMEIEHLEPGTVVLFQIEDPENLGTFLTFADGEADGDEGEVEASTSDGARLPFEFEDVSDLVGLRVRIIDAETETVLASGEVPSLVAD